MPSRYILFICLYVSTVVIATSVAAVDLYKGDNAEAFVQMTIALAFTACVILAAKTGRDQGKIK